MSFDFTESINLLKREGEGGVEDSSLGVIKVVLLDNRLQLITVETLEAGEADDSIFRVRALFKHALLNNATNIVVYHDQLSGIAKPDYEDKAFAKNISEAGRHLGVKLVDYIVLGDGGYYSLLEHNELNRGMANGAVNVGCVFNA